MIESREIDLRTSRRIVIIGSMGLYSEMLDCAAKLNAADIYTVVPEKEDLLIQQLPSLEFEEFKRKVSFAYLRKIRDPRTYCVLAINRDRHGILNYIGPNTFAEIAVAFAQSKRVYLIQGMPDAYSDELSAWRAIPLYGCLDRLVDDFRVDCMIEDNQRRLFD